MASKRPSDQMSTPSTSKLPKKSLKSLKKEIFSLLSVSSDKCGDFATGSALSDAELQSVPNIDINDFGILPLPLNKFIYDSIKPMCSQSPYGLGEQTLVDTSVRNSLQLDPQQFVIRNKEFENQVASLIEGKIKSNLGLKDATIFGKVYKLLIYGPGGKFAEHRDTEKHQGMFGTLIIQLPSVFTGGDLIVKHKNSSKVYKNSSPEKLSRCSYVAHYASCPHELTEVNSGYRTALVYSLCWRGNGVRPSPSLASQTTVRLCNLLNEVMDDTDMLQWALEYEYSSSSINVGTLDFLKGCDKNVMAALNNALEYDKMQCGEDRWELYIATADKQVTEHGSCTRGYYGRYGGSHDKDCIEVEFEEDEKIELSDFVPLTKNSSKENNLEFDFDPEEAVNGDDGYEFWGEDKGTGCSGPTGNEGATCERWYQRKVAVLWRTDKSLSIKMSCSVSNGIHHVLSLLKNGNLVEGEQGFTMLWESLDEVWSDHGSITNLLEMCVILKCTDKALVLLNRMHNFGIPTVYTANVIADVACKFKRLAKVVSAVTEILRNSRKNQTKHVLHCCSKIGWLKPTEIIDLVMTYTLRNTLKHSNKTEKCLVYAHVLEFMFKNKTFPPGSIENIVSLIDSLTEMESAISTLLNFTDKKAAYFSLFFSRFASLAYDELSNRKYRVNDIDPEMSITIIFKTLLTTYIVKPSLGKVFCPLFNSIKTLPDNIQSTPFKLLTHQILQVFPDKENLPVFLLEACRLRFNKLRETIRMGVPEFSWHQPKAVVPNHPQVQQFLRGPAQSFTYRNFNDRNHAENWANKHRYDHGCFMTLTPTGSGSSAAVEIVKTSHGSHKDMSNAMKKNKQEFNQLCVLLNERN